MQNSQSSRLQYKFDPYYVNTRSMIQIPTFCNIINHKPVIQSWLQKMLDSVFKDELIKANFKKNAHDIVKKMVNEPDFESVRKPFFDGLEKEFNKVIKKREKQFDTLATYSLILNILSLTTGFVSGVLFVTRF